MSDPRRSSSEPPAARPGDEATVTVEHHPLGPRPGRNVRRFRLSVVEGAPPAEWMSVGDRCSVGSHPSNDLCVGDNTVSRFHCEVRIDDAGALLRDLGSRNGTQLDGVFVREAFLRSGSALRVGKVGLRFELGEEQNRLPLAERTTLGGLVGTSTAMRSAFALLERVAASDVTVLLEGETGTGKGAAAEAVHRLSARKDAPFIIVDCGAIPANLLESELFGHERGAFTGADARRTGAFEEAEGGTLFLDEVGELPADIQPKLLRALEERQIRRIGGNTHRRVDLRIIAATNRDLRVEVNEKRFRADLYFRLAVARITLPSLRERPEDLPALVDKILGSLGVRGADLEALRAPDFLRALASATWPGNVRELRNYLERCLVFQTVAPLDQAQAPAPAASAPALTGPYFESRRRAADDFERRYLTELMAKHGSKTVQAAAEAGLDRVYLYRLLRRHGLR